MIEVLQFVFQDFWHWLGTFLIVGTVAYGLGARIVINKKEEKQ